MARETSGLVVRDELRTWTCKAGHPDHRRRAGDRRGVRARRSPRAGARVALVGLEPEELAAGGRAVWSRRRRLRGGHHRH